MTVTPEGIACVVASSVIVFMLGLALGVELERRRYERWIRTAQFRRWYHGGPLDGHTHSLPEETSAR